MKNEFCILGYTAKELYRDSPCYNCIIKACPNNPKNGIESFLRGFKT